MALSARTQDFINIPHYRKEKPLMVNHWTKINIRVCNNKQDIYSVTEDAYSVTEDDCSNNRNMY